MPKQVSTSLTDEDIDLLHAALKAYVEDGYEGDEQHADKLNRKLLDARFRVRYRKPH